MYKDVTRLMDPKIGGHGPIPSSKDSSVWANPDQVQLMCFGSRNKLDQFYTVQSGLE